MIMKLLNCLLSKDLVIPLRLKYRASWLWNTFNHLSISKCNILQILYLHVNLFFTKNKIFTEHEKIEHKENVILHFTSKA